MESQGTLDILFKILYCCKFRIHFLKLRIPFPFFLNISFTIKLLIKSLILIAKAQMERNDTSKAINTLKKALESISLYKKEGDNMSKQLSAQEKDIRRIRLECSQRIKLSRKKEKERAKAMFGGFEEEKKDSSEKKETVAKQTQIPNPPPPIRSPSEHLSEGDSSTTNTRNSTVEGAADIDVPSKTKANKRQSSHKRVVFADGTVPGSVDDNNDDHDYSQSSFFAEHGEALFIVTGIAVGWLLVNMAWKKR